MNHGVIYSRQIGGKTYDPLDVIMTDEAERMCANGEPVSKGYHNGKEVVVLTDWRGKEDE